MADWVTKAARFFGLPVPRAPAGPLTPAGRGTWWPVIREPYTGAWQRNEEIGVDTALSYFAVFACTTLIASDIGKLRLRLVEQDNDGIWVETTSPAFSPVLRRPNRYQNIIKFVEQWIVSKLVHGNTYALKERDARGVVVALYILDPTRVQPLVAPDGAVYYQLNRDDLASIGDGGIVAPAREIIHDLMVPLFHPLLGVSPIYACGVSASQGLRIQHNSSSFFGNGSTPGGLLTTPVAISQQQAEDMEALWQAKFSGTNAGKLCVLSGELKYESLSMSAVDAQLIDQLKWTAETICSCYHVPPSMIGVGPLPPYANSEPLVQQYYNQCLQSLLMSFEKCLDEGLELPAPFGTEFDIDDLVWMDTATKTKAAHDSIGAGALSPNEARQKYYGLGPVEGGDTPYLQQQYWPLAQLSTRETPTPPVPAAAPVLPPEEIEAMASDLFRKAWAA